MTILGTIALIALVILSILVLRVKSDPMENESVKKYLADPKRAKNVTSVDGQSTDSTTSPPTE
jgi:hypothetical protein